MAPRKRTESKHTPPTSPTTTTSHTSADHHHLRHTGPSISTRARTGKASSKPPPQQDTAPETSEKKLLAEVSPPSARTPFSKFMYVLLFCVLLLFGWYIYGMVILLGRLKDEVGWWGIVVSDSSVEAWRGWGSERFGGPEGARRGDLEGSFNALADALGISPAQVASAVKSLVPQASLTNIASKAEESGTSEAVRILIEDTTRSDRRWRTGMTDGSKGEAEEGSAC